MRLKHLSADATEERVDEVAHEEPLELQLDGVSFAVVMRTPGHDLELGTGFLLTEGIIKSLGDLEAMAHCTVVPTPEAEDNVLQIRLRTPVDLARFRRNLFASSSCGVCGKATLDNALRTGSPLTSTLKISREVISRLPGLLRAAQPVFDATGGLHAAALFTAQGQPLVAREDVGRHNAVDKVIGFGLREGLPLEQSVLMVSGRVSFELVQKAVAARVPVLAGISAPTSLGVTLVGFVREGSMNVYSRAMRVG